ncbi:MAG: hypothetical protein H7099_13965 [Gemmatimonadaceae bacterium]|nr:hypothetical protein [Gemmatimonadaceae bacterium]
MRSMRSTLSATIAGAALFGAAATPARADGRTLFTWSGTVDREAIIVMRGANLDTQGDGFESVREARFRVSEALPRMSGTVSIARADGRGDVEVIEQPSLFNGYTTRVRVRDRQSGADRYRLVVSWQGARDNDRRDGDRDDRGGYGRNDDRDGNGRYGDDRNGNGRDNAGRGGAVGGRGDAGALRWSGEVDAVAEIRIQGRRVEYVSRSGRSLYNVRFDVRGAGLPARDVPLDLRRFAGRGNVIIAQYPRAWNGWTAVIKIDDSRGGTDAYDFDLRW